ncbi:hypothetical protein Dfri01_46530 [Dyadobacter frigoris]|uniref:DUF6933 domain-containing protein n=1 Tax=Dyadobacter frigoris TaxID=2576211 RepID=UPI0024A0981E|nr:hypothetical protein [Dyadobacter frigoris]GLU55192.1 hypothetical protein Dfri01_46530 [Dyadobacter frigoris]
MVQIYCTQKLVKFIKTGIKASLPRQEHDWSAHLFFISGRKCIIFVNKQTLYTVMLLDIFKKDMAHINRLFLEAFIGQLKIDHILGSHEALIRDQYKEIILLSTDNDRKTLGTINNIISMFQDMDLESARQYASEGVNKMPWQALQYGYSKDMMLQELGQVYQ